MWPLQKHSFPPFKWGSKNILWTDTLAILSSWMKRTVLISKWVMLFELQWARGAAETDERLWHHSQDWNIPLVRTRPWISSENAQVLNHLAGYLSWCSAMTLKPSARWGFMTFTYSLFECVIKHASNSMCRSDLHRQCNVYICANILYIAPFRPGTKVWLS